MLLWWYCDDADDADITMCLRQHMISMMRLEQLYEKLWIPNYVELEGKDCRWLWRSKDEIGSLMTRRYLLWFVHISFLGLSYIQAWWGWCSSMREKKKKKQEESSVWSFAFKQATLTTNEHSSNGSSKMDEHI